MKYEEEILKRTQLEYIASYLLTGADPGPMATEWNATTRQLEQELSECLTGLPPAQQEEIHSLTNALEASYQHAGFCSGCRAGARLLGALTR